MNTTYVYILSTNDSELAVGYTDDIRRDIFVQRQEMPASKAIKLVYYETISERRQGIDRYIELKRLSKSQQKRLIEVFNPMWDDLSAEWQWGRTGSI